MYELTQVEKCKKMGSLANEFAKLRQDNLDKYMSDVKKLTKNIKPLKE